RREVQSRGAGLPAVKPSVGPAVCEDKEIAMSRLDQHVAAVQNKLTLARFLNALVWAMLVFAVVVTFDILIARSIRYQLPHPKIWFWIGSGVATSVAMIFSLINRPSRKSAAVAID